MPECEKEREGIIDAGMICWSGHSYFVVDWKFSCSLFILNMHTYMSYVYCKLYVSLYISARRIHVWINIPTGEVPIYAVWCVMMYEYEYISNAWIYTFGLTHAVRVVSIRYKNLLFYWRAMDNGTYFRVSIIAVIHTIHTRRRIGFSGTRDA